VVIGPEFGARMDAVFDGDVAASTLVTSESWGRRPLADHAREFAARLWAYGL